MLGPVVDRAAVWMPGRCRGGRVKMAGPGAPGVGAQAAADARQVEVRRP